jgi:23S rRNA pseudouridine2605 synthase
MKERIQKILSSRGIASRRKAEEMILMGRVTCNGQVCVLGQTADPDTDILALDGKILDQAPQDRVYLMLHKPRGFVTTLSDEKGRKNAAQLVADCGRRVYPVGRLDYDSEGLLLMTNDGEFANRLMHPSHEVTKVYEVTVSGCCPEALEKLAQPVLLDGYMIKKPEITLVKAGYKAVIRVVIHEGRNRQVRRMCAMAGMEVLRLKRVCEGRLQLGDLPVGKWRYLTPAELELLK